MIGKLLVALVFVGCSAGSLHSQSEPIVHTVVFPTGNAIWSLSFVPPSIAPPPSPQEAAEGKGPLRVKKIDIVRVGPLRHDTLSWSDGTFTHRWWLLPRSLVAFQPTAQSPVIVWKSDKLDDQRYDNTSFAWVGEKTFSKIVSLAGKKCRYYETEVPIENFEETRPLQAWIEDATGVPVAFGNTGEIGMIQFGNAETLAPLTMPNNFKAKLDSVEAFYKPLPPRTPR